MKLTQYQRNPPLHLIGYAANEEMRVLHSFSAWIQTNNPAKPRVEAKFVVVKGGQRSLLGRDTAIAMEVLKMGAEINAVDPVVEFPYMPNVWADFEIDQSVVPISNGYVNVPLRWRKSAKRQLRMMTRNGIISRVYGHHEWVSGISAVPKGEDCRLVVNMKEPNRAIKRHFHPMPKIEDVKAKLLGAKWFSKLDLTSAFHHIRLSDEAKKLTTFAGFDGLYQFNRLCFGINAAPELFQMHMERILQGIDNVVLYIDDILVFAESEQELQTITKQVLAALKENNLTLNESKCEYAKQQLIFLGFLLTTEGLQIDPAKVEAVTKFRAPKDKTELKGFLGLVNFLREHIPSFSDLTKPLRDVGARANFLWTESDQAAFEEVKSAIAECTTTLGFFDENDETILYTDASPYAVGAVLVQKDKKGKARIISFASKALTKAEKNYPQTQREGLGIVWGIEHFYYYLLGGRFTVKTDADGMRYIFDRSHYSNKPKRYLRRAEGWALRLEMFDYKIEHVRGEFNIADVPSRLVEENEIADAYVEARFPCEIMQITMEEPTDIFFVDDFMPLAEVKAMADVCQELREVRVAMETGVWPREIRAYELIQEHLLISNGVLTMMGLVILPKTLREKALAIGHAGHHGVTKTKGILRERVWWPRMSKSVTEWVKRCPTCTLNGQGERPPPMQRSCLPRKAWDALAMDFSGPYKNFNNCQVAALVDYRSRYVVAAILRSTKWEDLKPFLEELFYRLGWPSSIKTDNGAPFSNEEFEEWAQAHGVETMKSWPRDPQQNGAAEAIMKHIKSAAQSASAEGTNLLQALRARTAAHNMAPHSVTGVSPSDLLFRRRLRFPLPMVGSTAVQINEKELQQRDKDSKMDKKRKEDKKRRAHSPVIAVGDTVVQIRDKRFKGDTVFDPTPLVVTSMRRGDVTMRAPDGARVRQSINKLKRWKAGDGSWEVRQPATQAMTMPRSNLNPLGNTPTQPAAIQKAARPARVRQQPKHLSDYV
jgi:hypothetical protein